MIAKKKISPEGGGITWAMTERVVTSQEHEFIVDVSQHKIYMGHSENDQRRCRFSDKNKTKMWNFKLYLSYISDVMCLGNATMGGCIIISCAVSLFW